MTETILRKDGEWSIVDGDACRVVEFIPLGSSVEDGKISAIDKTTPYASVALECKKFPNNITGYVTHKIDFIHLWSAFKERGVSQDEEVVIIWSKKHLKTYAKIFSAVMPKMWVMVCQKGAFEIMTDQNYRPELTGEARWNAMKPIVDWKPEVME